MAQLSQVPQPRTGKTFPADEVVWGIVIRNGFDEIDDPWYHRGTTQHAYLEGNDNVAICGFRPPQSGPRTRRRSRLGLPTTGEHPMCGMCARLVVAPRPRVPVPVHPLRPAVAVPVAGSATHALAVAPVVGAPAGQPPQAPVPGASTSPWVRRAAATLRRSPPCRSSAATTVASWSAACTPTPRTERLSLEPRTGLLGSSGVRLDDDLQARSGHQRLERGGCLGQGIGRRDEAVERHEPMVHELDRAQHVDGLHPPREGQREALAARGTSRERVAVRGWDAHHHDPATEAHVDEGRFERRILAGGLEGDVHWFPARDAVGLAAHGREVGLVGA